MNSAKVPYEYDGSGNGEGHDVLVRGDHKLCLVFVDEWCEFVELEDGVVKEGCVARGDVLYCLFLIAVGT